MEFRGFTAGRGDDAMVGQGKLLNMDTLIKLLEAIDRLGPTSLYKAAKEAGLTYPTARRYLRLSMEQGLVVNLGRGSRGELRLVLSERGQECLTMLKELVEKRTLNRCR